MQIATAAVRADENAQLQQPQDVAASGTGKGGAQKGAADQLAAGEGVTAPVKVRPCILGRLRQTNVHGVVVRGGLCSLLKHAAALFRAGAAASGDASEY